MTSHRKKKASQNLESLLPVAPTHPAAETTSPLSPMDWQYLEAHFYQHLRAQPIIDHLLHNEPVNIVVLSLANETKLYLGAYAGHASEHPHNHVLKCHMLQMCLAMEVIDVREYEEERNINCGKMRRLFAVDVAQLCAYAEQIRHNTPKQ